MNQTEHFKLTCRTKRRFQWFSAMALAALTLSTSLAMAQTPDANLPAEGIKVQGLSSSVAEETLQTMLVEAAQEKPDYEPQPVREVD
jgi:glycine betaine/proline transport system substrate-binding protein